MSFVLDASVALAWCFSDEATESSSELLEKLRKGYAVVPVLWSLELGNILALAERKNRITFAQLTTFLNLLSITDIRVDAETSTHALHNTLMLARELKLTTYDACYVELAMRLDLPLASKDTALLAAAKKCGLKTMTV